MTATVVAAAAAYDTAVSTVTVSLPAPPATGHICYLIAAATGPVIVAPPPGYAGPADMIQAIAGQYLRIFRRVAEAGDTADLTITTSFALTTDTLTAVLLELAGVNPTEVTASLGAHTTTGTLDLTAAGGLDPAIIASLGVATAPAINLTAAAVTITGGPLTVKYDQAAGPGTWTDQPPGESTLTVGWSPASTQPAAATLDTVVGPAVEAAASAASAVTLDTVVGPASALTATSRGIITP